LLPSLLLLQSLLLLLLLPLPLLLLLLLRSQLAFVCAAALLLPTDCAR
jgi:hypothetical protein